MNIIKCPHNVPKICCEKISKSSKSIFAAEPEQVALKEVEQTLEDPVYQLSSLKRDTSHTPKKRTADKANVEYRMTPK